MQHIFNIYYAITSAMLAVVVIIAIGNRTRTKEKTYTKADLELAFLAGAKWWEYQKTGATMWQSDQQLVVEEAQKKNWPEWLYWQKEHMRG